MTAPEHFNESRRDLAQVFRPKGCRLLHSGDVQNCGRRERNASTWYVFLSLSSVALIAQMCCVSII